MINNSQYMKIIQYLCPPPGSYAYKCKILAIHLFNALSPTNMVSTVTQIRSGIIYHTLLYYFDVHLKLMCSYHLIFSLEDIHLHINYTVISSCKYVCNILKSSYIFYSITFASDWRKLAALFIYYVYCVVYQFIVLLTFVHFSASASTCSIYMYNSFIIMLNVVQATDIIHVHSHNILKGKPCGVGGRHLTVVNVKYYIIKSLIC